MAIGTGESATHEEIAEVHAHIRQCLVARFGAEGKKVRILYGGSVDPINAREILRCRRLAGCWLAAKA